MTEKETPCSPLRATRKIQLLVTEDEPGMFSAIAWNLPGAGSSGSTEAEAIERAKEAVAGVLESYAENDAPVPWEPETKLVEFFLGPDGKAI